ncbi:Protein-disulfide isomerase [Granulicella pectinivorans]|uniref:Protein-disulfide isomerase n=1 Tax=Granulicella pectinivorans TaxID=474950 RepID=A0A1I6MQZ9_9BACT|nr:thioredoxin domain-containing protein [Granulicella pectinivorans]SFS18140.1 Protein-disulfide isomerase [Granulicella pectinivorans]
MTRLSISIGPDEHVQGNPEAGCSLVEYGDYECPSCAQLQPVIKKLQRHFGSRLSFVFRNFPLREMHPWAEAAAETAEFAGAHGKFWEMHDLLIENQAILSGSLLLDLANRLGLSSTELDTALNAKTYRHKVLDDFEGGVRNGVNGTPTLFIDDQRYDGSLDSESLADAIGETLLQTEA